MFKKKCMLILFGVVGVLVLEFILYNNEGNLDSLEVVSNLSLWDEILFLLWKSFWNLLIIFWCCLFCREVVLLFFILFWLELDIFDVEYVFNVKKSVEELFLFFFIGSVVDIFSGFWGVSDVMLYIMVFLYCWMVIFFVFIFFVRRYS